METPSKDTRVFKTKSGAEVTINLAPWVDAKNLKKAVQRVIKFDVIQSMFNQAWVFEQVFAVDSDDGVDIALWPCLARCLYNGEKITPSLFDKADARGDYYEIVGACVGMNLDPLIEGLRLKLSEVGIIKPQAENIQKSESTTKSSS